MDKNSKKLLMLIGVVVGAFILVFVFVRFISGGTTGATIDDLHKKNIEGNAGEDSYIYNGYSFVYFDGLWYTQIQRKDETLVDIPLHFGPRELEDISFTGKINEQFMQDEVYITFDPTDSSLKFVALSSAELSLNLAKGIEVMPVAACDKNETVACENRPILTCDDKDKAIVYLRQTDDTGAVKLDGNCVELTGDGWELVKAVDRFLLQWYQIMQ